jgi:y4mF family transcriptional regulator
MKYTPENIGELVRSARKRLDVTQKDLAMTSGTGLRFIVDLERGKATCQLGKVLTVLQTLGIKISLIPQTELSKQADGRNEATRDSRS